MVYADISDIDLVQLISHDDRTAYTELYRRYTMLLLNHAYTRVHCRDQAKDVVQEVFVNLWDKRKELIINKNVSAFLYKSVRNIILNQIAHQQVSDKYISSIEDFALKNEAMADHLIREKQYAQLIQEEIGKLTPKMREVFELSRTEYLSHKEIALRLNISEQTVSKHISNALRTLRNRLGAVSIFFKIFM